jgi:hypothetical protein
MDAKALAGSETPFWYVGPADGTASEIELVDAFEDFEDSVSFCGFFSGSVTITGVGGGAACDSTNSSKNRRTLLSPVQGC